MLRTAARLNRINQFTRTSPSADYTDQPSGIPTIPHSSRLRPARTAPTWTSALNDHASTQRRTRVHRDLSPEIHINLRALEPNSRRPPQNLLGSESWQTRRGRPGFARPADSPTSSGRKKKVNEDG